MLRYGLVRSAVGQADPATLAPFMFWLMFRNIASDGLVFDDPVNAGVVSQPGCVLASPSWENTATQVTQDYVYHWTRDAAIVAFELSAAYAAGTLPDNQPLIDYVRFSQACQAAPGDFDRASFYINGTQRPWTDQTDGPALQTLALLAMYAQLDPPTQAGRAGADRREPGLPGDRLHRTDVQPVGGGVRLLVLRPVGAAQAASRRSPRTPSASPSRAGCRPR